ncbi:unnamed protein product [Allacma fusca]|uniref:Transposase n=1 Tax=Allacma fusca TaxID=39272 RepID=A0A8J2JYQ1_9HEXA|nr:unnamed protein product [Allacma fusca]
MFSSHFQTMSIGCKQAPQTLERMMEEWKVRVEAIKSLWYDYPHFDFESVYHPLNIWNRVNYYSCIGNQFINEEGSNSEEVTQDEESTNQESEELELDELEFIKQGSKSTGNLWKHMGRMHKAISMSNQPNSPNTLRIKKYLQPKGFEKDDFEKKLLDFIILTDQPFTITESESFQGFALCNRCNRSNHSQDAPGKISIIMDCCTLRNGILFNGIIATWINTNWEYEEILLDLAILKGRHSGKILAESLVKVFEDYQILGKISTITTDNASNNITMMKELESIMSEKGVNFKSILEKRKTALAIRCRFMNGSESRSP